MHFLKVRSLQTADFALTNTDDPWHTGFISLTQMIQLCASSSVEITGASD